MPRARDLISQAGWIIVALVVAQVGWVAAQGEITVTINDVEATPIAGESVYQITAYVTVTDPDGQPIAILPEGAFSVSQDGEAVQLESADIVQRGAAIILVIDTSGSMAAEGKMEAVREAATSFVSGLGPEDQVGVIYFNDQVVLAQDLSDDLQATATIIGLLEAQPNSGTCLYDAAYAAVSLATAAPPGQRTVVLLTDGIDELPDGSPCSEHSLDDVINLATDSAIRVPIYTIGVGTRIDEAELERAADSTGGDALIAPEVGDVAALLQTVAAQLKNQYALVYRSATTSGEHNLTVTVEADDITGVGIYRFVAPEPPCVLNLTGLDNGAMLDGTRTIRATVSGGAGVTHVHFELDGQPILEDDLAPFEVLLSGDDLDAGVHELIATAMLTNGDELVASLGFGVQAPVPIARGVEDVGEAREAAWLGWALPVGIGAAAFVVAVAVFLLVGRLRPRARVIGGAPSVKRSYAFSEGLTTDIQIGEVLATLTVRESISLTPGQHFDLYLEVTGLGRGADNDIVVPDTPVSRHHAEIRLEGDMFRVFDLGSTYGTFVNNEQIGERGLPIADGDELRLGTRTVMTFAIVPRVELGPEDQTIDLEGLTAPIDLADEGATEPVETAFDGGETLAADPEGQPDEENDFGTIGLDNMP